MLPEKHSHAFRSVPKTGVIYVMSEAGKRGFYYGNRDWANLGQGAPETGPIEGSPLRLEHIDVPPASLEYGTVAGIMDLRAAVARLYNRRYRRGMKSQYTAENVAISPGGRSGLTRLAAAMGHLNLGHFIPDYTAYEELLDLYRRLVPIPIPLRPERGFRPDPARMRERTVGMGLGGLLISNPCNPTGQVLYGEDLNACVVMARELRVALIMDEFYSHYAYDGIVDKGGLSAAAYVEDVDRDPVVILDGLTKNWRYPGLRLSWTVAPKDVIDCISSAGSFLDGGAPHPIQRSAIPLLDPDIADREAEAIRTHFGVKRKYMLSRLKQLGFVLPAEPQGGFYAFVSLENMPRPLQNGMDLFEKGLDFKMICVPGVFFDVNPGKRRSHIPSRLRSYIRVSYGPCMEELERGLNAMERLIEAYR
ncbi:MAG: pyridoxal phosphate-dependent aminotransferase [Acidobacteriota bacterium]|nr:pyridoxal phosphate-dependent aminotransferase [Acidobacteriota bacterium]